MSTAQETAGWLQSFKTGLEELTVQNAEDKATALRQHAIEALKSEPLPARKMERWRYTPVNELLELPLSLRPTESANDGDYSALFTPGIDAYRFVVENGSANYLGKATDLPEGVVFDSLRQAVVNHEKLVSRYIGSAINHVAKQNAMQATATNKDSKLFQHLNQSVSPDGLFIYIPDRVKLEKPVEVVYLKSGSDSELVQSHGLVIVGQDAEMTLLEKHLSDVPSNSFCNNQLELVISARATLKHYYLQLQSEDSWHRNAIHRIQDEQSHYQGWFGCCGSQWSRLEMDAFFEGENATSNVQGIQLALNGQVNDVHLDVRHDQQSCHSEQHFRGLVSGKSKIVFDGNITVSQDAQKTVAHLSDNNLMLSRSAEVDTKPQLEIYADDVQCSHGTTIGEIDEQQIFYLRSRGITENKARSMLSVGFVAELIEHIELEPFKVSMLDLLSKQLQGATPGETGDGGR